MLPRLSQSLDAIKRLADGYDNLAAQSGDGDATV
ncbi:hypothetical protein PR003_g34447 [Phytophthora rubi]|nr:hypothetical protein PR003_g34447 [Phytophthora rubi]